MSSEIKKGGFYMEGYRKYFNESICDFSDVSDVVFSKEDYDALDRILRESVKERTVEITEDSDPELFNFIKNLSNGR